MSEYQERWGVWCERDDGGAWCLMPDKLTQHRTYATREEAQADADATNLRNADWTGRKWEARRYQVTTATDPRDERIKQLAAENARLREALEDFRSFGCRHDTNPTTRHGVGEQACRNWYIEYIASIDRSIRERASAALK